jgi:L-fuconolactonase
VKMTDELDIVDAQVHVWAVPTRERPWGSNAAGRTHGPQSFLPGDVESMQAGSQATAALLVPPSFEGDYNDLVVSAAAERPPRFGALGRYPVDQRGIAQHILDDFLDKKILGVRLTFNAAADGWLATGAIDWFWAFAEEHGIPVSFFPHARHFGVVRDVAQRHPGLRLTIDHLAAGSVPAELDQFEQVTRMLQFAGCPNVSLKVSALPCAFPTAYSAQFVRRTLAVLVPEFTASRLHWGSDHTRAPTRHADYGLALDQFIDGTADLSEVDRALVLGGSLRRWLNWS